MLTVASLCIMASLAIAEIVLVFTMRTAVRELRQIRTEVPRMLAAMSALVLLVEGARVMADRKGLRD